MTTIIVFAVALALAVIPAKIAEHKGRNFWSWYCFGVVLWIVALPAALLVKNQGPQNP